MRQSRIIIWLWPIHGVLSWCTSLYEQICIASTCMRHICPKYRYAIRGRSEYFWEIHHRFIIIHEAAIFLNSNTRSKYSPKFVQIAFWLGNVRHSSHGLKTGNDCILLVCTLGSEYWKFDLRNHSNFGKSTSKLLQIFSNLVKLWLKGTLKYRH